LEKKLTKTTFLLSVDVNVEVFEPMKEGPSARLHSIPLRKGDSLEAYVVRETQQHYFVKFDDGGVAFLHKIAVSMR
jgi:hypothetical protein